MDLFCKIGLQQNQMKTVLICVKMSMSQFIRRCYPEYFILKIKK